MADEPDIPEKIIITPFDAADFINDDEDEIEFLNAPLELGDPDMVGQALKTIVRARGMRQAGAVAGIDLQELHCALDEGAAVELGTALRVLSELGIKLVAVRAEG